MTAWYLVPAFFVGAAVGVWIGAASQEWRVRKLLSNHDFSVLVTRIEGKRKSLSIAQVKEVLAIISRTLFSDVVKQIEL